MAKKKITSRVKHKPVRNYCSGRPNQRKKLTEHASKIPVLVLEEETLRIVITDKYQLSYNTHWSRVTSETSEIAAAVPAGYAIPPALILTVLLHHWP